MLRIGDAILAIWKYHVTSRCIYDYSAIKWAQASALLNMTSLLRKNKMAVVSNLNFLAPEFFFLILAHSVYKM